MCSSFGEVDFVDLETRFWPLFGCPHLGEADLVDFEVLVYFLQWAAFWHLDSGLIGFLFPGNLLTFFLFSLPLLHFHILRLVSLPWRVGLIAAAATSSRREAPWPEPNTDLVILTWLIVFAQVESIGLSKVTTQSRMKRIGQCITWGNACWRKLGAFRLGAFTVYVRVNATLCQCANLALSGFTSSLSSFFFLEISSYQSTH